MKTDRFVRYIHEFSRSDSGAAQLAVGAMLLVTILYATTII